MRHSYLILILFYSLSHSLPAQQITWQRTSLPSNSWIYDIAVSPNSSLLVGTSSGIYRSSDNGSNWEELTVSSSDTIIHNIVIHSNGSIFIISADPFPLFDVRLFRSSDNGTSWTQLTNGLVQMTQAKIAFDSSGSIVLALSPQNLANHRFYRSSNNGDSWDQTSSVLTSNINSLAINSSNVLFAGTGSAGIFASTDLGDTWTPMNKGLTNLTISEIAISRTGQIFTSTYPDSIYKLNNNDTLWTKVNNGFAYDIEFDQMDNIYMGTEKGVLLSTNNGQNWTSLGLDSFHVSCLKFTSTGYLIAGTDSVLFKSVQQITSMREVSNLVPNATALHQNYPNPFNPTTSILFTLLTKSFVSLKVYDLIGREVATIVSDELSAGEHSRRWNAEGLPSGVYFYKLQVGSFSETKKLILLR